jgi:hypothetical protein
MGQLSIALIIPAIVGLLTYVVIRLFWKLRNVAKRNQLHSPDFAETEKRLPQAKARPERASPKLSTVTLLTAGMVGGFLIVWYLLNSETPLILTLKHLAAIP